MEQDIKYLNIPNVCFSLTSKDDKREEQFKKQRMERGFDDSETWSLRDTIANFIIPRLEIYQELDKQATVREQVLLDKIELFLQAMKLTARDNGTTIYTDEEEEILRDGLKAFPEIFMSLWW